MEFNLPDDFTTEIAAINAAFEAVAITDAIDAVKEFKKMERERELVAGQQLAWAAAQDRNRVLHAVRLAEAAEFADAVAGIPDIDAPP